MNNQNDKNGSFFKSAASLKIIISLLALCLMGGLMIYAVTRAVENTSMTDTSYEDIDGSYPPDTSVSAEIPITDSLENPDTSGSQENAGDGFSTPRHWISISAIRPLTFRRLPAVRSAL